MICDALIVGSAGQDGRILTRQIRETGGAAFGVSIDGLRDNNETLIGSVDITKKDDTLALLEELKPKRIFYLAGYHHASQETPNAEADLLRHSFRVHVDGLMNFIDGMEIYCPKSRLFYAASSHVFGPTETVPQSELTPLNPNSAYGISKAAGVGICRLARATRDLFCCAGFLYNHESPLRDTKFVTAKIVSNAVRIYRQGSGTLHLGDLDAAVDWGYAPDYTLAMQLILEQKEAGDFVIATGQTHTVREFAEITFEHLALDWRDHIQTIPGLISGGNKVYQLMGDSTKLRNSTGWHPSVSFTEMVRLLVDAEIRKQASPNNA